MSTDCNFSPAYCFLRLTLGLIRPNVNRTTESSCILDKTRFMELTTQTQSPSISQPGSCQRSALLTIHETLIFN